MKLPPAICYILGVISKIVLRFGILQGFLIKENISIRIPLPLHLDQTYGGKSRKLPKDSETFHIYDFLEVRTFVEKEHRGLCLVEALKCRPLIGLFHS